MMIRSALLGAVIAAALLIAPHAHSDGLTRVTTYTITGTTYSGTYTTAGRTAGCALSHLGQTVHLVENDLWLVCEDAGDAGYFAEDSNRVDVYGIWLIGDYDYVEFY